MACLGHLVVGTALFASGAATAVTARKAGGICAVQRPITLVAPVAAPLAMRALPTAQVRIRTYVA